MQKAEGSLHCLLLVTALGVAVYLNWEYAKTSPMLPDAETTSGGISVVANTEEQATDANALTDPLMEPDQEQNNKNYGDAQLVSVGQKSGKQYFDEARLSRQKSRDEALDTLQKSLKKANLSEEEKAELTQRLSSVVNSITTESDIENLVKAKGFIDCVTF